MKTTANDLTSFCPTHPGEMLKEELSFRRISQRKFAEQIGVSYHHLNDILNGKRSVNTELALLLEAALGISAELFIKMQIRYNLQIARQDITLSQRIASIRKICAIL